MTGFRIILPTPRHGGELVSGAMVTARPNGFIEPRIPTRADKPPVGPDWVHEIKHDGHRR
jgi:ATP-dependent DNA ligase